MPWLQNYARFHAVIIYGAAAKTWFILVWNPLSVYHMNPLCRNQTQISIPSVVHSWIHPLWENCSPKSNSKYSPALPCPLVSTFPWRSPFIVFSFYDLALGLILYSLNIYLLLDQILRKSTVNVIKF